MKEGWHGDDYVILFEEHEIQDKQQAYEIDVRLPGQRLLGMVGWADFLVKDCKNQKMYRVPTVPMALKEEQEWLVEIDCNELRTDSRFHGKVKWYVKPIVFGGDPNPGDNMIWISHEDHVQAVKYWNQLYSELKRQL